MAQLSSTSNSEEQASRRLTAWGIFFLLIAIGELVVFLLVPQRAPIDVGERFYSAGTRPTLTASLAHWQTERAKRITTSADVVFIGDSSCTMGVIPEVIESRIGLDVENFCLVQWLAIDGHIDIFDEYLRNHEAPRALVYYFSDSVLGMSDAKFSDLAMRDVYRRWLGQKTHNLALSWPSTRLRSTARRLIGGQYYEETSNDVGIRDFMRRHQGFVRESRAESAELGVPRHLAIHGDSASGLVRLFSLAAKHDMKVYLMHAPVPSSADSSLFRETVRANQALVAALASDYPRVAIAWPFLRFAPTRYFRDYEHLTIEGAQYNSALIGEWMNRTALATRDE